VVALLIAVLIAGLDAGDLDFGFGDGSETGTRRRRRKDNLRA
jgi:hypothetical protein